MPIHQYPNHRCSRQQLLLNELPIRPGRVQRKVHAEASYYGRSCEKIWQEYAAMLRVAELGWPS